MNKDLKIYKELFSRDFSLPSVEAWVRGESINAKGWTEEKQPFLPYIITQRQDDTIHFYYNLQGVEWVQDLLTTLAKKDKNFLKKIENKVLEKLKYIRPIYEKEKILNLPQLKKFLKELEAGYPWFEAMWLFFQMNDESKVVGLNLKNLAKVRELTDKLCNSSDSVIRKSLLKIYPELGDLSSVLSTSEIVSGKMPLKSELARRYKGYFFGDNKLITGLDKKKVAKILTIHFKNEPIIKTRQLNGLTVYRGVVRGFVRRIMGHKQINEMKEGEILVSPMTIPDFLPAIKKAAAIVTDEGGVLCHAAIVSRELKKPCIVGTKFATQILKDGDLVEVDANNGIVRILNHAN